MSNMFSNFSKFIDQMDAQVGEMVQKQHEQEEQQKRQRRNSSSSRPTTPLPVAQHQQQEQVNKATTAPKITLPEPPTAPTSLHNRNHSKTSSSGSHHQNTESTTSRDVNNNTDLQLQHDFDVAISRLKHANSENDLLHRQLETLRHQNDDAQTKISQLESQVNKLSEETREYQSQKQQVQDTLNNLQNQFELLQKENHSLLNKAELAEENLITAQREAQQAKQVAAARIQELEKSGEIQEMLQNYEAQVGVLNKSLERLRGERDEWEKKHEKISSQLRSSERSSVEVVKAQTGTTVTRETDNSSKLQSIQFQLAEIKKEYEAERSAHLSTRSRYENMLSEKIEEVAILEKQLARNHHHHNQQNSANSIRGATENNNNNESSPSSNDEWEKRAKDLAELVMEKQSALELKRNEADQWRSRFETTQQKLREAELMAAVSKGGSRRNNVNDIGGTSSIIDVPGGGSLNNADGDVGNETDISKNFLIATLNRKGGKWMNTVINYLRMFDNVVQRFVGGLRRNSLLRLAVAFYVGLVHLWVVILLWNQPLPVEDSK